MANDANDAGLEARALELWAAASMDGVGARAAKARAACARGIDRAQAGAFEMQMDRGAVVALTRP